MPEALVPDVAADGGYGVEAASRWRHTNKVQIAGAVTSKDHRPGSK
jgi:hypothetical protein